AAPGPPEPPPITQPAPPAAHAADGPTEPQPGSPVGAGG
ncbi:MAG: hypothetical protein JWN70_5694, partial [Planctomycetaceae bacterium]|nr:hypothetical protein [Planctomycetaceae bacterium]